MIEEPGMVREVARLTVYSLFTLYMMAVLTRWTAPFLSLDLYRTKLRFIPVITDPLLMLIRRTLPPIGFFDWSPVAALLILWVVRVVLVGQ